jgi:hypothetical protein
MDCLWSEGVDEADAGRQPANSLLHVLTAPQISVNFIVAASSSDKSTRLSFKRMMQPDWASGWNQEDEASRQLFYPQRLRPVEASPGHISRMRMGT